MPVLSEKQLREISQLIRDHHTALVINVGLGDFVPEEERRRLVRKGLIRANVKSLGLEDAFTFGLVSDALGESRSKHMSHEAWQEFLQYKSVPLGQEERESLRVLKRSIASHITGLGARVDKATGDILVDADKALHRRLASKLKQEMVAGIEKRKSIGEIVTALRKSTQQNTRDWMRIVATELNNAYQEGKLASIQKSNRGKDPLVFKRPRPDACEECRKAYLESDGITPKVFRLSELLAHGVNVGKSKADRRPTVSSQHPWCQCELHELPPGFEFNGKGRMVYVGSAAQ